ncbi:MAG: TIGR03960 family B12-binding radical SAM protein [bacterium]|nr:TIGR03960 family B12-binding radical SAM protein [bacterium]
MKNGREILDTVLPLVRKPGRYTGGEFGAAVREGAAARVALAFPDVYEIGMSHLGLRILRAAVNERPGLAAERVFAPWPDMEAALRRRGIPLSTLESATPLAEFDVIGFSLQHELTYTNVLTMLDLGGVPLDAGARNGLPLVVAGGPGAFNPSPLEDFIDGFAIGEGEEILVELLEEVAAWKRAGGRGGRRDLLLRLARGITGLYVPSLYRRVRAPDGRLLAVEPAEPGVPPRVRKRAVAAPRSSRRLASGPVPNIEIVHDRVAMEIRRGCSQGCRFCQAGMIYRPVRDEDPREVLRAAEEALRRTGYDEVALCALSVGDYPPLEWLAARIARLRAGGGPVSLSLPSLRPDRLSPALADLLSGGRRPGVTLAPEAGTERMRRTINKQVSIDDLIRFAAGLRERGWRAVKLYFMIGLPGETDEDVAGIRDVIRRVRGIGGGRGLEVNATVAYFIPKAHTPFQWDPMEDAGVLGARRALLRGAVRGRGIRLMFHDLEASVLEAVFSRGDRPIGAALLNAWRAGCRFDGWSEQFDPGRWKAAFASAGMDPHRLSRRRYGEDECLPWEAIDAGLRREFLIEERRRAGSGEPTPDCARSGCAGCGVCGALGFGPSPVPAPTEEGGRP